MSPGRWRDARHLAGWAAVGAGTTLAALTVLTIGVFVLVPTAAVALVLARRAGGRLAGPGLVLGAGLPLLYVGYLNRGGPGMVCTSTATGESCTQQMSPWPWVAAGLLLMGSGVAMSVLAHRSRRARR
jgi:hypothetical protein